MPRTGLGRIERPVVMPVMRRAGSDEKDQSKVVPRLSMSEMRYARVHENHWYVRPENVAGDVPEGDTKSKRAPVVKSKGSGKTPENAWPQPTFSVLPQCTPDQRS